MRLGVRVLIYCTIALTACYHFCPDELIARTAKRWLPAARLIDDWRVVLDDSTNCLAPSTAAWQFPWGQGKALARVLQRESPHACDGNSEDKRLIHHHLCPRERREMK